MANETYLECICLQSVCIPIAMEICAFALRIFYNEIPQNSLTPRKLVLVEAKCATIN